jgi:hypothetical protein
MKTVIKIALGVLLAGVVLIGGCAVMIGAGAESVSKEIDKQEQQSEQHGRNLAKKAKQLEHGMTRAEVIELMGKPSSVDKSSYDGLGKMEILSWDVFLDGRFVMVTLDNGEVTSIDRSNYGG